MKVRVCLGLVLVCFAVHPAEAFVEKLNAFGGPLPCHQVKGAIIFYIDGVLTGGQLASSLEAMYLATAKPPQSWSANDNLDNAALKAKIDAETGSNAKRAVAFTLESHCGMAEHQWPEVDTPPEFRAVFGLPAIP